MISKKRWLSNDCFLSVNYRLGIRDQGCLWAILEIERDGWPLLSLVSAGTALASRDAIAKTPLFLEHSLSGSDNGRDRLIRAWSWLGSVGDFSRFQRGLCLGGSSAGSDSRSGLIIGDFSDRLYCSEPRITVEQRTKHGQIMLQTSLEARACSVAELISSPGYKCTSRKIRMTSSRRLRRSCGGRCRRSCIR